MKATSKIGGRGEMADLSIDTRLFANIIETSRADIGDVLYPTTGVNLPETELPPNRESRMVSLSIDCWLYTKPAICKRRWFIEDDVENEVILNEDKEITEDDPDYDKIYLDNGGAGDERGKVWWKEVMMVVTNI
ncbi:hypothetical protein BY996DRAFT_6416442 [Phakopsora pachyrhizi]|nr:hypothetical protein BY996DRAFT_6416442 [Phakopsora pachyrhizi]